MPPNILISADMEGSASAATPADVTKGTEAWQAAKRTWIGEINAVASALLEAGAGEVVVVDAHGDGANLAADELAAGTHLIRGSSRRFGMLEGIDADVQGVVFLGYHGICGSGGVLSHAFMEAGIYQLTVTGAAAGEGTVNAYLAASFGVPVILVAGDQFACEEAERYAPAAERVAVKESLSRFTARVPPAVEVETKLAGAAQSAMRRLLAGDFSVPVVPDELAVEIEFTTEGPALAVSAIPGVARSGTRAVSYRSTDVVEWYRCLGAIWTVARVARGSAYA